jgi:hypothetical protein
MEDNPPPFWIGHHEDKRLARLSPELIQQAHSSGVRARLLFFGLV